MKVIAALGLVLVLVFGVAELAGCEIHHDFELKRPGDSYRPPWCDTMDAAERQRYPGQCL